MKRFASMFLLSLMAVLTVLSVTMKAGAGDKDVNLQDIRTKLSEALANGGSSGTEFYFSVPPCYEVGGTSAINLYIASPVKTKVVIEVEGRGFISSRQTVANDIIEVKLGPGVAQAFSKTDQEGIPPEQVYPQAAIHVKAGAPVVIYCSIRFPYTSDTFLAIPIQALGKEYIVASMADMTWMYGGYSLPSITTITAAYDNTKVTFTLGGNAVTKTSGGMIAGQTKQWNLMRGDVVVIGNSKESKEGDMSGSKVVASKPVGVSSGNQCANVPTTLRWCDYIAEMELPTNTWGKTLLIPRVWTRKNSGMIKIFAKEPNTQIFKDGSPKSLIQKAGGVEGTGFLYERVNANANTVAVISGTKPISATYFNPGQEDDNVVSDPFQMDIYPNEQFQKEIIFCTPGIKGGFKFDENYINLIYELNDNNTMPDDLEFGTSVNGVIKWQQLRAVFGPSIGDVFAIKVNGKRYASKQCILPGDNVYRIRCSKPFACYSYGFSNYDSYGHPTSAALVVLGDTNVPDPKWTMLCDGTVEDGTIYDYPNDDSIRSNMSTIVLDPSLSKNYTLENENFIAGETRKVKWQLRVDNPDEDAIAVIQFSDRAGNDTSITITYQARKVRIQGKDVDFGTLKKGTKATKDVVIKNEGKSKVTISRLELKNGGVGVFTILNNPIPFDLDVNEEKTITIEYNATNDGAAEDSLGVGDDCVFRFQKKVLGQTDVPIIVVDDIIFQTTKQGSEKVTKTLTIKNTGGASLNVTGRTQLVDANIPGFTYDPSVFVITNVVSPSTASPLMIAGNTDNTSSSVDMLTDKVGKFAGKIIFSNDATTIDSICIIRGEINEPGLGSNIVEFGRRHWQPATPYTTDKNNVTALTYLTNTGNADVNVRRAKVGNADSIGYFAIDLTMFERTIKPGDTVWVPVTYSPQNIGDHKFEITYESDAPKSPTTYVSGTGIVGKLVWEDITFPTNKVATPSSKTAKLHNMSQVENPYYDDVVITDIEQTSTTANAISETTGTYGLQDMAYDKAAITFPYTLKPNQDLIITGLFLPNDSTDKTGQLKTKSNAMQEVTSTWNGKAYLNEQPLPPIITPDTKTICLGDAGTILTFRVTNPGDVEYSTVNFTITGGDAIQFGVPTYDMSKLPLKKGQFVLVSVPYNPTATGTHSSTFTAVANGSATLTTTSPISATANQYTARFKVIGTSSVIPGVAGAQSSSSTVAVNLQEPVDGVFVQELKMTLKYNNLVMQATEKSAGQANVTIEPTGALAGWTVVDATIVGGSGEVRIHVKGNTPMKGGVGKDLLRVEFTFGLPPAGMDRLSIPVSVTIDSKLNGNGTNDNCAVFIPIPGTCSVEQTCAYDLRRIAAPVAAFGMMQINPNPVSTSGTELHFGVGYNAPTTIDLINSNGEIVTTLVNEELKGGNYTLQFVPTNISSGSYTLRMQSGYFVQSQTVVITK